MLLTPGASFLRTAMTHKVMLTRTHLGAVGCAFGIQLAVYCSHLSLVLRWLFGVTVGCLEAEVVHLSTEKLRGNNGPLWVQRQLSKFREASSTVPSLHVLYPILAALEGFISLCLDWCYFLRSAVVECETRDFSGAPGVLLGWVRSRALAS